MRIESKAPTRVDLAGSTLDIWPLYLFHPGALTLNVAISRYAKCIIETHRRRRREYQTGFVGYQSIGVFPVIRKTSARQNDIDCRYSQKS